MRRLTTILLPLALLLAAACGDSPTEPDPTVDGTWRGPFTTSGGTAVVMRVTMNEAGDGTVSGTGSFDVTGPVGVSFEVSGSHDYPDVSLTIATEGAEGAMYTGTLASDTRIDGLLDGSGFENVSVVLVKQ